MKDYDWIIHDANEELQQLMDKEKDSQDDTIEEIIPEPKNKNNKCMICEKKFKDYFEHIESKNH